LCEKNDESPYYLKVRELIEYSARGNSVIKNGKPSFSIEDAAHNIARAGTTWNGHNVLGKEAIVTYTFLQDATTDAKFSGALPPDMVTMTKTSLQAWADVANITFVEVPSSEKANISILYRDNGGVTGGQFPLQPDGAASQLRLDSNLKGYTDTEYLQYLLTHETGHTLGLSHTGNFPHDYKTDATYAEDSMQYSVMSYWGVNDTNGDNSGYYAPTPGIDDIAAIQLLYGANNETRTGDDIYGFNSNTGKSYYTLDSNKSILPFTIWDGGGNDTLDFSGFSQDQQINLNESSFSNIGGHKGNVSIAAGVTIENAIGGSGNDVIVGNDADNIIKGGAGNDVIYGGGGQDQLWGGSGEDIFVFSAAKDSPYASPDKIWDFETGKDKIDLSFFNHGDKGSDFVHFVDHFSGQAGEALLSYNAQSNLSELALNVSGSANPDFLVHIVGQVDVATDFIV